MAGEDRAVEELVAAAGEDAQQRRRRRGDLGVCEADLGDGKTKALYDGGFSPGRRLAPVLKTL